MVAPGIPVVVGSAIARQVNLAWPDGYGRHLVVVTCPSLGEGDTDRPGMLTGCARERPGTAACTRCGIGVPASALERL